MNSQQRFVRGFYKYFIFFLGTGFSQCLFFGGFSFDDTIICMGNYHFKGEKNNYCKLKDADVELIRQIAGLKKLSYRKIAAMFGVTHSHIFKIVKGKTRA